MNADFLLGLFFGPEDEDFQQTVRRYVSEDGALLKPENLKSYNVF
jgi:hypothetical protein